MPRWSMEPGKAGQVARRQGRAGRAAETSQGEEDVSGSVFPLLGPVFAQVDNALWWLVVVLPGKASA